MSFKKSYDKYKKKTDTYLKRRPHRSFRRTKRRDYNRSLDLPGYISFTRYVGIIIWQNRKIFGSLALLYAVMTALMVGIASQETYLTLTNTLDATSGNIFGGGFGEIGKAGLMFVTAASGGLSQNLTDVQQLYAGLITLITVLTSIWLLRNIMAGHEVRLRDGLYNSGSPIVSTFIVSLLIVIQLLPLSLAVIGFSAASLTGLLNGGVEAMLFWIAAGLLTMLSLYWITSTFFALIIVTLPGMYPFKAIRTAGDLVVGRRLRILLRLIWMLFCTSIAWILVMIPVILLDKWIKGFWSAISWVPTVPFCLLVLGALTIVWTTSYIYLLYRSVVADDANPA
ncbi:MAG: hypothetical protein WCK26_00090 [Candidatus Saccharibacteria bacterium]